MPIQHSPFLTPSSFQTPLIFVLPQCFFHVDEDLPTMSNKPFVNSSYSLVVFLTFFHVVAAAAVMLTITTPDESDIPKAVTEGMVLCMICKNHIKSLSGKRAKSNVNHDTDTSNKHVQIQYNHERAHKCVHDDWMGPISCFPDKSFKCTFRITRSMVDMLVKHMAKRHSFWRQTVCHVGKPTAHASSF